MKSSQINRVLDLVRRGERCLILDSESDEVFVLMPLSEYERARRAEDEEEFDPSDIIRRANEDFADWHPTQEKDDDWDDFDFKKPERKFVQPFSSAARVGDVLKDKNYFKKSDFVPEFVAEEPVKDWSGELDRVLSEEPLADLPDDGVEEEKFYLEPVI